MKRVILAVSALLLLSLACTTFAGGNSVPKETPTPTKMGGEAEMELTPVPSMCNGLSGALEMQVLVGPAEAVGLSHQSRWVKFHSRLSPVKNHISFGEEGELCMRKL